MKLSLQLQERDMFHSAYRIQRTVSLVYVTIKVDLEIVLKSCVYLWIAYLNLWTDFCAKIDIKLSRRFIFRCLKLPSQYVHFAFEVTKFSKWRTKFNERMQNIWVHFAWYIQPIVWRFLCLLHNRQWSSFCFQLRSYQSRVTTLESEMSSASISLFRCWTMAKIFTLTILFTSNP